MTREFKRKTKKTVVGHLNVDLVTSVFGRLTGGHHLKQSCSKREATEDVDNRLEQTLKIRLFGKLGR